MARGRIGPRRQMKLLPSLPMCLHSTPCVQRAVLRCILLRARPTFNATIHAGAATCAVCLSHAWWTWKWDSHPPSLWILSWNRDAQKRRGFSPDAAARHPLSASAHTDSPSPFFFPRPPFLWGPGKKEKGGGENLISNTCVFAYLLLSGVGVWC